MPTLNYTTTVPVTRTVAEVQAMLGEHGASAVAVRYVDRVPAGVTFTLVGPHGAKAFTLPIDVDAVHRLLNTPAATAELKRKTNHDQKRHQSHEHAARVAWRVAKDWLEAQLAMVQAQMVQLDQVMLPYLHVDGDTTLYESYRERELRALPGATS